MKITFNFDDDSYAAIVVAARRKKCAVVDLLLDAITSIPQLEQPLLKSRIACSIDYKISFSEGTRPFTMEDVYRIEEENDLRGDAERI
ncbi:hypothetical protein [Prosthecobacter sp.]|jgi:hypothetical protein|uniref:hypothetical protein n=1 Tax=Prosthecobacter sp. TaxID=1965333 RepID=UPI0037C7E613